MHKQTNKRVNKLQNATKMKTSSQGSVSSKAMGEREAEKKRVCVEEIFWERGIEKVTK